MRTGVGFLPTNRGACVCYQTQLEYLSDQATREEGQEKSRELMDQILRLLAEHQKDSGKVSTANFIGPIHEENSSYEKLCPRLVAMPCKSCGSLNQNRFTAEIAIHSPGLKNLAEPVVWVFPEIFVCLDCGKAEFTVPEAELRLLAKGDAAGGG
jgi:hypothetical protein